MPMAEQVLDHPDVDALFQEVGGEAVAQCVDGDRLVETGSLQRPRGKRAASCRGVIGRSGSAPGNSQSCRSVVFQ